MNFPYIPKNVRFADGRYIFPIVGDAGARYLPLLFFFFWHFSKTKIQQFVVKHYSLFSERIKKELTSNTLLSLHYFSSPKLEKMSGPETHFKRARKFKPTRVPCIIKYALRAELALKQGHGMLKWHDKKSFTKVTTTIIYLS